MPTLSLVAGHPYISCPKSGRDSLEAQVDQAGNKGMVFLTIITHFEFTDNSPLPAAGPSAVWKYRVIRRLNDEQVGQWSDVAARVER